jgi:hypothetical protein
LTPEWQVLVQGEKKYTQSLVEQLEGTRPLRRPRCRKKDKVKIDPKYMRWKEVGWIQLAVNTDKWRDLLSRVIRLQVR